MANLCYRSEILAPSKVGRSIWSGSFRVDKRLHYRLLRSAQQLRARCYLADGAISPAQITQDERFEMPDDEQSWHFLIITSDGEVVGAVRYSLFHPSQGFSSLRISELIQFTNTNWVEKLIGAVQADLRLARERGSLYAELGGWAIAEEYRGTKLALETVLASYAWGALVRGGCICSCTATVRHRSASILRRIGGRPLETADGTLPAYWDPRYGCEMEVLRFDSHAVEPRYQDIIAQMQSTLRYTAAIQSEPAVNGMKVRTNFTQLNDGFSQPPITSSCAAEVLSEVAGLHP